MQVSDPLINSLVITNIIRAGIYLIVIFYAIFALVVVRQVSLMTQTLITPVSPIVKAAAIIHGGFAIGFALFIIGTL